MGYAVAVLGAAAAAWLRFELMRHWGPGISPYITFYPVVIMAALLGGMWAGVLATLLAAGTVLYFFLEPTGNLWIERRADVAGLIFFTMVNLMMSAVGGALRAGRQRLAYQARELEEAVEGLNRDAAQRERAEETLRQSRQLLNQAIQAAGLGTWDWNLATDEVRWSPRCFELAGFAPVTPMNYQRFLQAVHPDDRLRVDQELRAAAQQCRDYAIEIRSLWPDGSVHWVLARGRGYCDEQGRPARMSGVAIDVTEQKRAEQALRESEERFRVVQEHSPDGCTIFRPVRDQQGRVVDFTWIYENAAIARMNGTDPAVVTGRRLLEVFPAHRGTRIFSAYQEVAETGRHRVLEELYGGESLPRPTWFRLAVVPAGGDIAVLAQDITERKEAQQVLARSRQELERLVARRTAKLREMVAELEQFSYTITHDMRAPLRAMRGLAGLLVEECGGCIHNERLQYIQRIADAAYRMDQLITDALQYSTVVRGKYRLEPVDSDALLREMLDSYPQFQPPHAKVSIQNHLPVVLANRAGLTQCFSNLLGNAVKFVHPGQAPEVLVRGEEVRGNGGEQAVETSNVRAQKDASPLVKWHIPRQTAAASSDTNARSGPVVRIWFEDRGIGIEKEHHDRIWRMFERLNKSYGGTGIGLALVRKAVERMGGHVGLESEPGRGSRFWVELRRAEPKLSKHTVLNA